MPLITYTHIYIYIHTHVCRHTAVWQMSLFKLTEVRPDSLPLLHHPEKTPFFHAPPACPFLHAHYGKLLSCFRLLSNPTSPTPPLSHPTPSLSIHPYSCQTSSWPSSTTLNPPPFFIQTDSHTHSPTVYAPGSICLSQCRRINLHYKTRCLDLRL